MLKNILVLGAGTLIIGLLILDLLTTLAPNDFQTSWQEPPGGSTYRADVEIQRLRFDQIHGTLRAVLGLVLVRSAQDDEISKFSFSLQSSGSEGTTYWLPYPETWPMPGTTWEEIRGEESFDVLEASQEMTLFVNQRTRQTLYPFDDITLRFLPRGFVDGGVLDPDLWVHSFSVSLSDPNFHLLCSVDESEVVCQLKRSAFVRMISVALLACVLVFYFYLFRLTSRDELLAKTLGFMGALWGVRSVLVPRSLAVFPSLIDYVVLILFFVLFLTVIATVQPARPNP